jgi:hypothetical protein
MLSLFTSLPVWFRIFSGWVHRSQQDVIACLVEENRLFKQRLGDRRLHFTPSERRRLARCYDRFSAKTDDDRHHQDFRITANRQRPFPPQRTMERRWRRHQLTSVPGQMRSSNPELFCAANSAMNRHLFNALQPPRHFLASSYLKSF